MKYELIKYIKEHGCFNLVADELNAIKCVEDFFKNLPPQGKFIEISDEEFDMFKRGSLLMIIFDLDGTLADCEHRRHFVDRNLDGCDHWHSIPNHAVDMCDKCKVRWKKWKPDWPAFHEACSEDKPIKHVIEIFDALKFGTCGKEIQIWSGRCESVKEKTRIWINKYVVNPNEIVLKMRPIGDNTPDDQLKERWLDEAIAEGETIDFVVDDRPKVVRMWRRRGIFVFDVNQSGEEF